MTEPNAPLNRSIGFTGVVRWLIGVVAALVIGDAFLEGRYGLGVAGLVFLVVTAGAAVWLWRSRQGS